MTIGNKGSAGRGKAFLAFGTINFVSKDSDVMEAIRKCSKLKHRTKETNIGRCFNRYTCEICGFSYEIDSSD